VSALRIAVGFKVTPDYEALRPGDWAAAETAGLDGTSGSGPDVRFIRRVLGPFDEAALELALRVRDARAERGLETNLAAFTVGGRETEPFLATLQALSFKCARVETPEAAAPADRPASLAGGPGGTESPAGTARKPVDLDFAPAATAALVAACAQRLGGDVLLLGERGVPGGSGTVPFLAAEALGRTCVVGVTGVEPAPDDRLRVTFTGDDGPLRAVVVPPCVLAVGNAVVSMLRVPNLKERLAVRNAPVDTYSPDDLGVDLAAVLTATPAGPAGLEPVDRSRAGVVVPGETPEELARALYEGHLRARLEQL
jgi:electron transfer flavoprotein beta subunit